MTSFLGQIFLILQVSLRNSAAHHSKFSTCSSYFLWSPEPNQICSIFCQ